MDSKQLSNVSGRGDLHCDCMVFIRFSAALAACSLLAGAAAPPPNKPGYDYTRPPVQPASETLDLATYTRIREEGLNHSHIMEYASGLLDGIGPRLTGSPNLNRAYRWTQEQFTAMGCANPHLESWGEFGMGWRQIATSVDMT